ncbi:pirin family protein [Paraliomyxa miuraensis]|uniref:pirin family protein n=1 Tax=Paraliomyxa miuraensis TaxID=376150 RepID=UPI00224D8F69|nr:pirin family protein [Paraliomyxa miuraensis]MCX4247666.1 pirin family protein [Paraliomyxa miuraensis]
MTTNFQTRSIATVAKGIRTSDGAGVRLLRSLGTPQVPLVDPFLMLDEFRSDDPNDYIAGFPPHPHRGFETVTYMLAGSMEHKDSVGNTGRLRAGSVQWMTAARGIIHSEMPKQVDGLMWGFQLWVNLPAKDKLSDPRYQDIDPGEIPERALEGGGTVRVIAGRYGDLVGPVGGVATEPLMLDVGLRAGGTLDVAIAAGHNGFAYVFEGRARLGDHEAPIERGHLAVLDREGDGLRIAAAGDEGTRVLLVAGKPIGEPVARHGPFVMNTRAELEQAFRDYQSGRLAQ